MNEEEFRKQFKEIWDNCEIGYGDTYAQGDMHKIPLSENAFILADSYYITIDNDIWFATNDTKTLFASESDLKYLFEGNKSE